MNEQARREHREDYRLLRTLKNSNPAKFVSAYSLCNDSTRCELIDGSPVRLYLPGQAKARPFGYSASVHYRRVVFLRAD